MKKVLSFALIAITLTSFAIAQDETFNYLDLFPTEETTTEESDSRLDYDEFFETGGFNDAEEV